MLLSSSTPSKVFRGDAFFRDDLNVILYQNAKKRTHLCNVCPCASYQRTSTTPLAQTTRKTWLTAASNDDGITWNMAAVYIAAPIGGIALMAGGFAYFKTSGASRVGSACMHTPSV